ncbi:hypothetical protein [Nocardioides zeicaulis]|uniref:Uncharacterized protein n=1 Tax=Nocardioides zeicaulis TaxID=1776857 RepID=A0ABV6E4L5_9ACTN
MSLRTAITPGAVAGTALLALVAPPATAATADRAADARAAVARTTLTFTVDDCDGCEIQLVNALRTQHTDVKVWSSKRKKVRGGEVRFTIATSKTWGMSVNVRAPWEGQTGYVTNVAWRYNGMLQGDPVTLEQAVTRKKASACWEGVRRRNVTVPLVVEQVEVDGVAGRVPGSIAFVPETQLWLKPMREVVDGVLGSQDVNICH